MNVRSIRLLVVVGLLLPVPAKAASLSDDFSTNPFGVPPNEPQRWCERYHHVHWQDDPESESYEMMFGLNGGCCTGVIACGNCSPILGQAGSCGSEECSNPDVSSAAGCKHLLISSEDLIGDERDATIAFSVPIDLDAACKANCAGCPFEHVKVAAAAHPNCEAGIEARVTHLGSGSYGVQIVSVTNPLSGYDECGTTQQLETSTIDGAATFSLAPGGTPRYEISLSVTRNDLFPNTKLTAVAEVYDRDIEQTIASVVKDDLTRPAWYDQEGQRFAFGGMFPNKSAGTPLFDDFSGSAAVVPLEPDDPANPNGAPAVDTTIATDFKTTTSFLYDPESPGTPPLQTAFDDPNGLIDPEAIESTRAAVIRGHVKTESEADMAGVSVTVLGHEEFGRTHTRLSGEFDMAVNGGEALTLVYEKDGFLTVHRQVDVRWLDYVSAADVVMIERDVIATEITLSEISTGEVEVHQGSLTADDDGMEGPAGPRQATLLFLPGTTATMTIPGVGDQPIDTVTVRATEYTVEPNGLDRMPAPLPPTSAYTYAVELSVDEAEAAGATRVTFSNKPVIFYLENFLGFPFDSSTGRENVPVGYYDREKGQWVPSENGRFVRIASIDGGTQEAALDLDGDADSDTADTDEYTALGIEAEELHALGSLYSVGDVLWRVPITHFSTWDCNWGFSPPAGAGPCGCPDPDNGDGDGGAPDPQCGSIIGCQSQTLGEGVDVNGTPFRLIYDSRRMRGYAAGRSLLIYLESDNGPAEQPIGIELEVEVAGQKIPSSYASAPAEGVPITWDGNDEFGRPVQGKVPATVRVGYSYQGVYERVPRFGYWGNGNVITGSRTRREVTLWQTIDTTLEAWDARGQGLGGWTLDQHHAFDPLGKVLHLGDGTRRTGTISKVISSIIWFEGASIPGAMTVGPDGTLYYIQASQVKKRTLDGTISVVAGNTHNYSGDGGPATAANLRNPAGLTVGPDNALYVADGGNHRIRRIDFATGKISTVVGPPCAEFAMSCPSGTAGEGDGGPATGNDVRLNTPRDVDFGPDGSMYIAEPGRLRRVTPDSIIDTLGGNGDVFFFTQDGVSPLGLPIGPLTSIAVSSTGDVYFPQGQTIRRITGGILDTVAGGASGQTAGDGGPAAMAILESPRGVSFGPDGTLYFTQTISPRVREIRPDGIINTIAGTGTGSFSGDGGPAGLATLRGPTRTAVAPDGTIYVADTTNDWIRRISLAGLEPNGTLIPSEDGREVYEFDVFGRHLNTRDALTGAELFSFSYDTEGLLSSVTDRSDNVTTIQRSGGQPASIEASGGQMTDLSTADGYLTSMTNDADETTDLTYHAGGGGLLATFTDPRGPGHSFTFTYDSLGRLELDEDPEGGSKELARTNVPPSPTTKYGFTVAVETAMGRLYSYFFEKGTDGSTARINTTPDGLATESVKDADERRTILYPDLTEVILEKGPEQDRFGMLAPIWKQITLTTPAMRAAVPPQAAILTTSRDADLADPADPFSLTGTTALEEQVVWNGRTFKQTYDATTRTIIEESPEGRQRLTKLDTLGRVIGIQIEGLHEVRFEYDLSRGRLELIKQGTPSVDERIYTLGYDTKNRLTSITDPRTDVTAFAYDLADRVTMQTLPDTNQIGFGYDPRGNLTSLAPPGRPAHGFEYTKVNLEETYLPPQPTPAAPLADPATRYEYNLDRQLERITRPKPEPTPADEAEVQVERVYESGTDRLERVILPTGEGELSLSYSPTGQLATIAGPLLAEEDNPLTLSFTHDGFLPLSQSWSCETPPCPAGTIVASVAQEYDTSFRRISQTVNGVSEVTFGYDDDDLLTDAGDLGITRDPDHGLILGTELGLVTDVYAYNDFGEVETYTASYDGTPIFEVTYTERDDLGRIVEKTERIQGGPLDTYEYTYDDRGRLDTVTKNSVLVADYDYDANGNRTDGPNLTTPPSYDHQDRLLAYEDATYTYTANGELETKTDPSGTTTYEYDALGNLRRVVLPSDEEIEYLVDGLGRRIGKKVDGDLVQGFLWEDQLRIAAELNPNGTIKARFVYGDRVNVPEYMVTDITTYRVVRDHLGSPRLVIDVANGSVAQRIDYDEFGNATLVAGSWGVQPFGFAGGLYDDRTELSRFGARDYASDIGRWVTKDPMGFAGKSLGLYSYAISDPVNKADAEGMYVRNCSGSTCIIIPESGDRQPVLVPDGYGYRGPVDGGVNPDGSHFKVYGDELITPSDIDVGPNGARCAGGLCKIPGIGPFEPDEPWPLPDPFPTFPDGSGPTLPLSPEEQKECKEGNTQ